MTCPLEVPNRLLLELVEPLLGSTGWFLENDTGFRSQYVHIMRPESLWAEHGDALYTWLPCHPRAPWWVRELLHELAEHHCTGQIDPYQAVFLCELLRILGSDQSKDELAEELTIFASSTSPVVQEADELQSWLTSSPARGEYLMDAMRGRDEDGAETHASFGEALAAAQAVERRHLAEIVLGALTSDHGVLRRCLLAEFEGASDWIPVAKDLLLKASRLVRDGSHDDIRQLAHAFDSQGLLGISPIELEIEGATPDEERVITERQQILARATLTIGLLGSSG